MATPRRHGPRTRPPERGASSHASHFQDENQKVAIELNGTPAAIAEVFADLCRLTARAVGTAGMCAEARPAAGRRGTRPIGAKPAARAGHRHLPATRTLQYADDRADPAASEPVGRRPVQRATAKDRVVAPRLRRQSGRSPAIVPTRNPPLLLDTESGSGNGRVALDASSDNRRRSDRASRGRSARARRGSVRPRALQTIWRSRVSSLRRQPIRFSRSLRSQGRHRHPRNSPVS